MPEGKAGASCSLACQQPAQLRSCWPGEGAMQEAGVLKMWKIIWVLQWACNGYRKELKLSENWGRASLGIERERLDCFAGCLGNTWMLKSLQGMSIGDIRYKFV